MNISAIFGQGGMHSGFPGSGGFMGGGFFMFVFWILIIVGAIWLVLEIKKSNNKTANTQNNSQKSSLTPEELAKMRLARGEISREEFEEIISSLEKY